MNLVCLHTCYHSPTVRCSLTRTGSLRKFSGDNGPTLSDDKFVLAEWNPPHEDCKFKFVTIFNVSTLGVPG